MTRNGTVGRTSYDSSALRIYDGSSSMDGNGTFGLTGVNQSQNVGNFTPQINTKPVEMLQASYFPNKNFGEQDLKRIFSNRNYNNSMSVRTNN
jgi:hypothetical protein